MHAPPTVPQASNEKYERVDDRTSTPLSLARSNATNAGRDEGVVSRFRKWGRWLGGIVAAVFIVGLITAFATGEVTWRLRVIGMKAQGEIPGIGWRELLWDMRPQSSVFLRQLPVVRSLDLAVENPYWRPADSVAGANVFENECASCHGVGAIGADHGPSLTRGGPLRDMSDWAIYRTILHGVPGTAMSAHDLPPRTIWQIAWYLRRLQGTQGAGSANRHVNVSYSRVLAADADSSGWYTYSGNYQSHRYGRLSEINARNVHSLRVAWQYQSLAIESSLESSPVVADGMLFTTEPPATVVALDASTGALQWRYARSVPDGLLLCCGRPNRGVALLDSLVYLGTLDAHLVALQARTGRVVWDKQVASSREGYSITGAPLAIKDKIITGVGGGEFGIRGFIVAYDGATGAERWRFWTVPSPGAPGSDSWSGDSWKHGGAPTWLTGSYDPALNLLYWGVGNPGPDFNGDDRAGDNLYSNSVVALDADSGSLRWHFQFTPHDEHDWDAVQVPVLLNAPFRGNRRSLMAWANRNGFYYLLDRKTGKFLLARPFVRQTWAAGIDSMGRPQVLPTGRPTREGNRVYPSTAGATNWWSPSYSPSTGLLYVPTLESSGMFYSAPAHFEEGEVFAGSVAQPSTDAEASVRAIDPLTGQIKWDHRFGPTDSHRIGGILSTAGGVVFIGNGTILYALDGRTGEELWRFNTGGQITAAPITYMIGGTQYVVIAAGRALIAFAVDETPRGPSSDARIAGTHQGRKNHGS